MPASTTSERSNPALRFSTLLYGEGEEEEEEEEKEGKEREELLAELGCIKMRKDTKIITYGEIEYWNTSLVIVLGYMG